MKIFCKDIQANNSDKNFSVPDYKSIHIWLTETSSDENVLSILKKSFNSEQLQRAERFAFEKDRNQFITAHGTLRSVLSKYLETTPSEIQFKKNKNRKPLVLFPLTTLKFNVSHSENKILIAISNEEIGADIEMIKPGFEFKDFIKTYFSQNEQAKILDSQNPNETFYKFWTRKEAVLKASGLGIIDNLKEVEVCNEENYSNVFSQNLYVYSFKIEDSFFASIACTSEKPLSFLKA